MDTTQGFPQSRQNVKYSDHSTLNTLDYYIPRRPSTAAHQLWIIYIHGGAWRDPEIDSTSFLPTQTLLSQSRAIDQIAGFASINYRLSPYPSHPRIPSHPADPARTAHHPDHLSDILAALRHLQDAFGFGTRYLLVGHSCGATLAFQAAMMHHLHHSSSSLAAEPITPPLALDLVEPAGLLQSRVHQIHLLPFHQLVLARVREGDKLRLGGKLLGNSGTYGRPVRRVRAESVGYDVPVGGGVGMVGYQGREVVQAFYG
ncbi:hypothetical protein D0864_14589 [Hortaea werneckii]|uniref:Uncharacterized protein n=1 Tax=Hortaea werneckii TaxID=91943 RepID=A0A3M7CDW0_HORWE|nr:hypothetical protein D0864_14589 [Hortaea werneckii]